MASDQLTATDAIATYIEAKDHNRPELMADAFLDDCELEMAVKTTAIAFPSAAAGLEQVTRVLVRDFSAQYDNVRTFCLSRPPSDHPTRFRCGWLVGMTARQDGALRVGCGNYDWHFRPADGRVERLSIEIALMSVLPAEDAGRILPWLAAISYPWCTGPDAAKDMPSIEALAAIRTFIVAR